jgi:hypothetical protein
MTFPMLYDISQIPWDKHPLAPLPGKAIQSGVLELKCIINSYCPFVKEPRHNDAMVFNGVTLSKALWELFDDDFKTTMTYDFGSEGIYFIPKFIVRNNYLISGDGQEIESGSDATIAANNTTYKEEQTFIISESPFGESVTQEVYDPVEDDSETDDSETDIRDSNSIINCGVNSVWQYLPVSSLIYFSVSQKYLDYKYSFWDHDVFKNLGTNGQQQFLLQAGSSACSAAGVHWKLLKKTPLFRGEDFFIKYKRMAKVPNTTSLKPTPIRDSDYLSLDFLSNISEESYRSSPHPLSLSDQAYFVIEVGRGDQDNNYLIIIAQRSYPVFVRLTKSRYEDVDGNNTNRVSQQFFVAGGADILSTFKDGPHGSVLLAISEGFTISVRNHLGKIHIQFNDLESDYPTWIIDRRDEVDVKQGNVETTISKTVYMNVPRGTMSIWGGNISCAFNFGPIQYSTSPIWNYQSESRGDENPLELSNKKGISFLYPPIASGDPPITESGSMVRRVTLDSILPIPEFFALPKDTNHNIKLTSTNEEIEDIIETVVMPESEQDDKELFTQDAQFYKEYLEYGTGSRPRRGRSYDRNVPGFNRSFIPGRFFFGKTIKEIGRRILYNGHHIKVKDSSIEVWKSKKHICDDPARRLEFFKIWIEMRCGDHIFGQEPERFLEIQRGYRSESADSSEPITSDENYWVLLDCKTPILSSFRLESEEDNDPRWKDNTSPDAVKPYEIDVSDNVLEYSESWLASDFYGMEHTATIQFLLNSKMNVANNTADAIFALQDKAFYIDIWAGYRDCNYTLMGGFYKLFTGICYGGNVGYDYSKKVMTCKIHDYSKILEDQLFINSPFYDGVYDVNAVLEILQLAGFRSKDLFDPAYLVRFIAENKDEVMYQNNYHVDGRPWRYDKYALPSMYQRLEQPAYKFQDGSNYADAISKITKVAGKLFYFDELGIAHYEDYQDFIQGAALNDESFDLLYAFTTNPNYYHGQMMFNTVEHGYEVDSVYNHIKIISNTPDQTPLLYDNLDWDTYEDPTLTGFVGYKKTMFQREPVWGDQRAVEKIANFYKTMFKPAVTYKFETYGVPLRALDFVSINQQQVRVTKVSHTLNPSENKWWMNVECERFQPIDEDGHHMVDRNR